MSTLSMTHEAISKALCDDTPLTADQRAALLSLVAADKRGQDAWDASARWQPIETAPKNGQRVLLWWRTCKEAVRGRFSFDEEFDDRPETWPSPEFGWRCDGDQCIPRNQEDCTHWMPLPPPPAA